MTRNYRIGTINTKPIPPMAKSISQEDREKIALEEGISINKVPYSKREVEFVETSIDWVSHGNYAIIQRSRNRSAFNHWSYIEMEFDFFDQIIEAFETKEVPKKSGANYNHLFDPFWQGDIPMRGMSLWPTRLQSFFYNQKEGLVLNKRYYSNFTIKSENLGFTIYDFKKIRDIVHNNTREKPIHYCKFE